MLYEHGGNATGGYRPPLDERYCKSMGFSEPEGEQGIFLRNRCHVITDKEKRDKLDQFKTKTFVQCVKRGLDQKEKSEEDRLPIFLPGYFSHGKYHALEMLLKTYRGVISEDDPRDIVIKANIPQSALTDPIKKITDHGFCSDSILGYNTHNDTYQSSSRCSTRKNTKNIYCRFT